MVGGEALGMDMGRQVLRAWRRGYSLGLPLVMRDPLEEGITQVKMEWD